MEASELTPKEETLYKSILVSAKNELENKYGAYMKKDILEKNQNIETRIMFVSPDVPLEFSNIWHGVDITENKKHIGGFNTAYGEFSIVENPKKLWNNMNPRLREELKEIMGADENWLEDYFVHTERITMAVHELIHAYQDPNLPNYIKEYATSYYTEQILADLNIITLTTQPEQEKRAKVYSEIVSKYGDDVHRVFFNSIPNDRRNVRQFIIDIFPKGD